MVETSDPPTRASLRRRRFSEPGDLSRSERMRDELPAVPVLAPDNSDESTTDEELRRRCEVILEQVGEINGILARGGELPADYTEECRDRLVAVARSTEEILESVSPDTRAPGSMSAWLLRVKRRGSSVLSSSRKTH